MLTHHLQVPNNNMFKVGIQIQMTLHHNYNHHSNLSMVNVGPGGEPWDKPMEEGTYNRKGTWFLQIDNSLLKVDIQTQIQHLTVTVMVMEIRQLAVMIIQMITCHHSHLRMAEEGLKGRQGPRESPGRPGVQENTNGFQPADFYKLYLTDDLVQKMVDETNLYAQQYMQANPNLPPHSRARQWSPVQKTDMEHFLGLCLLMGPVKKPSINYYWSTDPLLQTPVFGNIMSRDKFLLILRFFHLNDNDSRPDGAD